MTRAVVMKILCVFLLYGTLPSIQAETHSLYYVYTALSKPVDVPGVYQFSAMGLLDDRQIDTYNSRDQKKIPTQTWMKDKMQEDYWEKGTQSRKSKEQWFNVNVGILMDRMRHNQSDLHVLQWRHGCEVQQQGDDWKFSKGVSEYGYDGEDFLSFDDGQSQWVAPLAEAQPTKRKWDGVPILNQYTKGYLEKECVDWLNKFREYGDEELRNGSPPQVQLFARKSITDDTKLKLICLATGFFPKDVTVTIRKDHVSVPKDETESTGVRPNHDGTFQMRTSVWIKKEKQADYDCVVSHRSLKEPVTAKWGNHLTAKTEEEGSDQERPFCLPKTFSPTLTPTSQPETHSLYYVYTALSKLVDVPGIYQFSAMGLLDDRQIDSYNSRDQKKIPTQTWMKDKMQEDYWEKGTQSRKSKEQWFNVNVGILMDRMRHNQSDLHVLQWRHGCEIKKQGDDWKFSKGVDEYAYDGRNFLSFDTEESQWVAPVAEAIPTKRKWDGVPILNQYTKGYLEKECVDWLNRFREYGDEELRNAPPPQVQLFTRKSITDDTKLKLTCLATGFLPKDVMPVLRKCHRSLPEDEVESTGVLPNHDGTFQMRTSVGIKEEEKADYYCYVAHRSLKEPVFAKWADK